MIHVRLFCGAGMSTSLLARKMLNYAEEKGIDATVDAKPTSYVKTVSAEELAKIDCGLIGPQVAFEKGQLAPKFEAAGVPYAVIPMQDYGMVNGPKVMQMALDLIEAAKK
mgnify:CR=1 FL=1